MIFDLESMLQDISGSNNVLYNIITGVPAISNTSNNANSEDMGFAPLQENPGDDDTISQLSDGESYQKKSAPPLFDQSPIVEYKKGESEIVLIDTNKNKIATMNQIDVIDKTNRTDETTTTTTASTNT